MPSSVAIRLLENFPNRGKGAAVQNGIVQCNETDREFFLMPIFRRRLMSFQKLLSQSRAGEVDIAFGSRALNRKLIGNRQPWRREQGGRVFNLVVTRGDWSAFLGYAMRFQSVSDGSVPANY